VMDSVTLLVWTRLFRVAGTDDEVFQGDVGRHTSKRGPLHLSGRRIYSGARTTLELGGWPQFGCLCLETFGSMLLIIQSTPIYRFLLLMMVYQTGSDV
jgi:hypothetical protein